MKHNVADRLAQCVATAESGPQRMNALARALDGKGHGTEKWVTQSASVEALKARIREEYREMPGMCLTFAQACRLWQMDARASASILDALVADGFLRRTPQGAFRAVED